MTETTPEHETLLAHTAEIVSAHVSNNAVAATDLPAVIETVFATLSHLGSLPAEPVVELKPAVPIKKSVQDDHLICLEDGKKLKMLKRHLATAYGMTPEDYRAKWGLPHDYPMVAPSYSETRKQLAKRIGLGRKPAAKPAPARSRKKAAAAELVATGDPGAQSRIPASPVRRWPIFLSGG